MLCFDPKTGILQVGGHDGVAATTAAERVRLRAFLPEQTAGTPCGEGSSKVNTQTAGPSPFPQSPLGSSLEAHSPEMKRISPGLVRSLHDPRQVDQSKGRFSLIVAARVASLMISPHFVPPRAQTMYGRSCQFGYHIVYGTCKHYRTSS